MDDQNSNLGQADGSQSTTLGMFEPLFVEENEDYFEDCLEEIEAALTLPREALPYSEKCREALQVEFTGLMQQMLVELEVFEATHPNIPASLDFKPDTEMKRNRDGFAKAKETCIPRETETLQDKNDAFSISIEPRQELTSVQDMSELKALFESCIEEVGQLEHRRDALVQELLELEESRLQEVQTVRSTLEKEQCLLSKVRLERQTLLDEAQMTKRRLFTVMRDGTQSQVELQRQQNGVQQLSQDQKELRDLAMKLEADIATIQSEHQSHLESVQKQLSSIQGSRRKSRSYLSEGRRASCDLQQYLQGGIKTLEEFYEPRIMSLLKRREASTSALSRAKEQYQVLRAQLEPLRKEEQALRLQESCLEERLLLMETQRRERLKQHRETTGLLEETSRRLKTELEVQRRRRVELEMLKNCKDEDLLFYRAQMEDKKFLQTREKIGA